MATLTIPETVPSPAEDAEHIRKACKGWGTDEKALISILAHRDASQRKQIQLAYEELYKESLTKRLESELHGDLERAIYRWMFNPIERQAVIANTALKKGLDFRVIIEVATIPSSSELLAIKQEYHSLYQHSLEEDVAAHTTGDFRKLLVGIVSTYRYDGQEVDVSLAQSEAHILHDAIKQKAFNSDEVIRILTTRSKAQLNATFNRYKDEHGLSITKAFGEKQNEFVVALRTVIRSIISPVKYYEKVLRDALNKKGVEEDSITRVVVTRAEKDLGFIKEAYFKRTNITLEQSIEKDTSRHYKEFLLALVTDN